MNTEMYVNICDVFGLAAYFGNGCALVLDDAIVNDDDDVLAMCILHYDQDGREKYDVISVDLFMTLLDAADKIDIPAEQLAQIMQGGPG